MDPGPQRSRVQFTTTSGFIHMVPGLSEQERLQHTSGPNRTEQRAGSRPGCGSVSGTEPRFDSFRVSTLPVRHSNWNYYLNGPRTRHDNYFLQRKSEELRKSAVHDIRRQRHEHETVHFRFSHFQNKRAVVNFLFLNYFKQLFSFYNELPINRSL